MVAKEGDQFVFLDVRMLRQTGAPFQDVWTIWTRTSEQSPQKYDLLHVRLDCQNRTMTLLEAVSYNGDAPATNSGPAGATTLPPESTGERVWLFACSRVDKYATLPNVNSIGDALALADAIRSPEKAVTKLLSDDDLMNIATDFHKAQSEGGMVGVVARVEECYREAGRARPERIQSLTAYCLILDIVAYKFDTAFRDQFKQKFSRVLLPTPSYEDATYSARLAKHATAITVDHSLPAFDVLNTFADKVFAELNRILEQGP